MTRRRSRSRSRAGRGRPRSATGSGPRSRDRGDQPARPGVEGGTNSLLVRKAAWSSRRSALIIGGIGGHEHDGDGGVRARARDRALRAVGWPRAPDRRADRSARARHRPRSAPAGPARRLGRGRRSSPSIQLALEPDQAARHAWRFAWGLAFASASRLLGSLYPAWRAVSLTPVEALRRE